MKPKGNNVCTLYIARHGETEWNIKRIIQGQSNSNLTPNGIEQAKMLCKDLRDIKFDALYSSDLSRAKQTAEIISLEKQLAISASHLLRERNYGSWQGKPMKEYSENIKQALDKLGDISLEERQRIKIHEDVESDHEIVSRFITILREVSIINPNKNILVISHGGIMRAFLKSLGYFPREIALNPGGFGNCGYMRIECDGINFEVKELIRFEKAKTDKETREL